MILSLLLELAFEPMDCIAKSIFDTPVIESQPGVNTLWMNSFGTMPYLRAEFFSPYGIGIGVSDFGNEIYKENEVVVVYSREVKMLTLGASIRGMKMHTEGYEDMTFGGGAGIGFKFKTYANCDLTIRNFNSPNLNNENVPGTISYSLSFYPVEGVQTDINISNTYNYPIELRLMNKIRLSDSFFWNIGLKNYPAALVFGVNLFYSNLGLSYYTRTHSELGMTHILTMDLKFKK